MGRSRLGKQTIFLFWPNINKTDQYNRSKYADLKPDNM